MSADAKDYLDMISLSDWSWKTSIEFLHVFQMFDSKLILMSNIPYGTVKFGSKYNNLHARKNELENVVC